MPLGVLNKDETKVPDMIDIMVNYQQFSPTDEIGRPVPTILFGDGLSCERAHDAQVARANHSAAMGRLEGLHPAIQEWHNRALCLQVLIPVFVSQFVINYPNIITLRIT